MTARTAAPVRRTGSRLGRRGAHGAPVLGRAAGAANVDGYGPPSGGRAGWAIRRWWWTIVAAAVIAMGLVALGEPGGAEEYEARSLIVARQLTLDVEQLPAYLDAVFTSGTVEDRVRDQLGLDGAEGADLRERLHVEPVVGTIAGRVVATDTEPARATRFANEAARALVTELNAAGPGIGVFAVQEAAHVPTVPVDRASPATLVIGAGAVAALVALGAVVLWAAIRCPVGTPADAAGLLGTEPLGTVDLRRAGSDPTTADTVHVQGLDALARRLVPGPGVSVLVTMPRHRPVAERLAELLARAASPRVRTEVLALEPDDAPVEEHDDERPAWLHRSHEAHESAVVVVLDAETDVPQMIEPGDRIAAVVVAGTPAAEVGRLATPFLEGELLGVAVVRARGALRPVRRPAPAPEVRAPHPA